MPSTIDVCGVLLPDSGRLQEEDAEYANRRQRSRHTPALPLYTEEDADRALRQLRPLPFEERSGIMPLFTLYAQAPGELAYAKRHLASHPFVTIADVRPP